VLTVADAWLANGRKELTAALNLKYDVGRARDVILLLGDGMGVATVTSARIFKGQQRGDPWEETRFHMETLPHIALAKVSEFV
jgi:alkaline phosphatase